MKKTSDTSGEAAARRRRAEECLRQRHRETGVELADADTKRLLHELQVHQIELEMQNEELQQARATLESALEKYSNLYDFAPVGYFSLDEQGRILEANLTGAALLGVERSQLVNQRLLRFVDPASQPAVLAFLERVFARTGKQVCEAALLRKGAGPFWASFHGVAAFAADGPSNWCRVAVSDVTLLKQGEKAQRRVEALALANRELRREILRRQAAEQSLKKSERRQARSLEQSRLLQEKLRLLSRQVLRAQEAERQRISRELHDVIAQTLTSINVRLAAWKVGLPPDAKGFGRQIAFTQRLVEHSVKTVHRFIRELRPTVLDDLGLIPALYAFLKTFRAETGIRVSLSAFAAVEQANGDKRTILYRVAQEALTNIARHAQAARADVKIQKLRGAIRMTIRDDGRGFELERVSRGGRKQRFGLLGMRERVEMVGGNFTLHSAPGKGTTVVVRIPITETETAL
jgi:PAS domain S-box-containing protein